MSVQELQKFTAVSKYARYVEELSRREVWPETVGRYADMMVKKHPHREETIRDVCGAVEAFDVLPSMRGMQFGGPPVFQHNSRLYNCTGSYMDRIRFFQEAFYLLLCGSGVGYSVQERHVSSLPKFSKKRLAGVRLPKKDFVIPDNIEGWADSAGVLLSSWHEEPVRGFEDYQDCEVRFVPDLIRKAGSKLSFGVGVAPGPAPLMNALLRCVLLLRKAVASGLLKLDSIHGHDLMMHLADSVVSGGVRRSACIVLFDLWDQLMLLSKTGDWGKTNPQRARANNSAMLLRGRTTFEQFEKLFESTRQFGEPGFYWADEQDTIPNPCFRGSTRLATSGGMVRIDLLHASQRENVVVTDLRAGKGDVVEADNLGVQKRSATRVVLTKKNAKIYRVDTEHGYFVDATAEHEFPTTAGRKKLSELLAGDTLLLQSAEGEFGTSGSFDEGYILGLITGDGCLSDGCAFIDIWANDFGESERILSAVNKATSAVKSNGRKPCGNLSWQGQQTSNVAKKRIGSESLYRFLRDLLAIDVPESIKERVPECVWTGSRDFVRGYLQGLFITDGSVQVGGHGTSKTISLRLNQSNKPILEDVQALLVNFGIVSRLYLRTEECDRMMPDGRGGEASYRCRANYDLIISRPNLINLLERVGLAPRQLIQANSLLDERGRDCRKPERYTTKVLSITEVGCEDVYCLCQPETNTVIANGVVAGQCVEIGFWCRLLADLASPDTQRLMASYQGPVIPDEKKGFVQLSGWQMCNLSTINGKTVRGREDFLERCRKAALLGTWQASYTDFPYLGEVSEQIVRREALLGVSIGGVMHHPSFLLRPDVLRDGALMVVKTNEAEAVKIGINPGARNTCVKPDGNSASLLGGFSGGHAGKMKRGFRIVQVNKMEAPYRHFKSKNRQACEPSKWAANGTDDVVRFVVEYEGLMEEDMTAVEFLNHVKTLQIHWVGNGKVASRCTRPGLSNNVSNTVRVRDDEWDAVKRHIFDNQEHYSGVALIGKYGDRDYAQAPFTGVHNPAEQEGAYGKEAVRYATQLLGTLKKTRWKGDLWDVCQHVLARGPYGKAEIDGYLSRDDFWCLGFDMLVKAYFDGDRRMATYCLKDAHNWRLYCELKGSFVAVDYAEMVELDGSALFSQEVACGGGACEL